MSTASGELSAHELVRTYLQDRDRKLWPWIDVAHLERLVASLGTGCDPLEGEEPIAIMIHTNTDRGGCNWLMMPINLIGNPIRFFVRAAIPKAYDWNYGTLATDRRIVVRDWLDAFDGPYEEVVDPTCSGGISSFFDMDFLTFTVGEERHSLTVPGHRALQRFLVVASDAARSGKVGLERVSPPTPSPGDPTGAVGFIGNTRVGDPRAELLLQAVAQRTDQGALTAAQGLDLARRVALLHRTTVGGRGSRDGLWVSPLRRSELEAFFDSRLGRPGPHEPVDGMQTIEYTRDRSYTKAALGTALVLASGRLDGVLPKGNLRISYDERSHGEGGDWTGYRVEVRVPLMWQPMAEFESEALYKLHLALLAFESQVLARRILLSPELDAQALLEIPQEDLDAALAQIDPDFEARQFRQPRDFGNLHKRVDPLPPRRGLARDKLPKGAPRPKTTRMPVQIGNIALVNISAGLFTFVVLSFVYCFGGVTFLALLEEHVLSKIKGVNEDATSAVLLSGLMLQMGGMWLTGPLRALGGFIVLLAPASVKFIGWFLILMGLAGLVVMDIPGFLASLLTLYWVTRSDVREYLS